jgi:hypothetical protein
MVGAASSRDQLGNEKGAIAAGKPLPQEYCKINFCKNMSNVGNEIRRVIILRQTIHLR